MTKTIAKAIVLLALLPLLVLGFLPANTKAMYTTETFELITAGASGLGGDGYSERPNVSADGRYIVFGSSATDLIPGEATNGNYQIFIYDVYTGVTKLITTGSSGIGGDGDSRFPEISADTSTILFQSNATDLIPGFTTNGSWQLYLYDVVSETFTLITPGLGGDGLSDTSSAWNNWGLSISADGNKIAFGTSSNEVVPGTIPVWGHIYLYDVATSTTSIVSRGAGGMGGDSYSQVPTISADGTKVVFHSNASDLVDGITTVGQGNIFIYDVTTGITTLITKGSSGVGTWGGCCSTTVISADNSLVSFATSAPDLIDGFTANGNDQLYLYDVATEVITLVTTGPTGFGGDSATYGSFITADGKFVGFMSRATDLINGIATTDADGNAFLYNVTTGEISLLSLGPLGLGGNARSNRPTLSNDLSVITFHSEATDLIDGITTNGNRQIYAFIRTNFCDITFDSQNGTAPNTVTDVRHCVVTRPADPVRSGYAFRGWYTAQTGGTPWDFNDPTSGDVTLYAQWAPVGGAVAPIVPGVPNTGVRRPAFSDSVRPSIVLVSAIMIIGICPLLRKRLSDKEGSST